MSYVADTKFKSIFISDIHLGTKGCQAKKLVQFLKNHECEKLYLVGDIIDGWRVTKKWYWPNSHTNVIRHILKKVKQGTEVYYIAGNHDEVLRPFINFGLEFGRIKIMDDIVHEGINGKKYYVVHGDYFDGVTRLAKWLVLLGDNAYTFLIWFNLKFNWIRKRLGMKYWSLSKYLKANAKKAVDFIFHFKNNVTDHARKKGYDGVICGHIHTPEILDINGITYMNDGDWVESCTALVEQYDGTWHILDFDDINLPD